MKIPQILCASTCALLTANAQDRTSHAWENLETFRINKDEARAFFVPHFNVEAASKILNVDDIDKIYDIASAKVLNKKWKFFFAANEDDVKPDFFKKNFNDSKWDSIDVPCSWQARGYDKIFYNNIDSAMFFKEDGGWLPEFQMKDGKPSEFALNPIVPEMHRQRGIYRTSFAIPQNWNGREIFIRFNGVRTGYNVYVNGEFAGYSEDSFTPGEFNISKFLQKGENSLAVEVFKHTTGAAMELQDMPHIQGITRDVVLIARSPLHIRDYYAPVKMSADLKTAQIDFNISLRNLSQQAAENVKVEAFLIDPQDGKKIPLFSKTAPKVNRNAEALLKETVNIASVKLWSPDAPNYYQLVMELKDTSGNTLEAITADFGFRRFDWENPDNQFFFNNKPYKIKGVNHHDWSPDKGKSVDFAWLKKDIELIKNANMNSLRTSHYPKDDKFYMLCTRYGIALLDEANYETHRMWDQYPAQLDNWVSPGIDRMKNMVLRDRNIPSVIMFSTNNESSPGNKIAKTLVEMEELSRKLDPTRPVHCESGINDPKNKSDFESPMYGEVARMKSYLHKKGVKKPFFFCEYTHAMGNGMGNFKDTWDLMRAHKDLNGGYIWDWVDQGLYLPREDKPDELYLSDGRDWGTRPSANNFSYTGMIFADRTYGVKYHETQILYQDIQIDAINAPLGKFKISNEFFEANVKDFSAKLTIERDGEKLAETKLADFDIPAGESKEIAIKLPPFDSSKSGVYTLKIEFFRKNGTLFAPKGSRAAYAQFEIINNPETAELPLKNDNITLSGKGTEAAVKTGNIEILFNDGDMLSYKIGGVEMLAEPMSFDISSAWTDNTRNGDFNTLKAIETYSMKLLSSSFTAKKLAPNAVEIASLKTFANKDGDGFSTELIYRIIPGGAVQVAGYFRKINEMPTELPLPRIGNRMRLSKEFCNVDFLGCGPLMNYVDRKEAQLFGRYRLKVSDGIENYSQPQDQGNRENVRWAAFTNDSGKGMLFAAPEKNLPFAWLPNTQEEIARAKHPHNLPESKGPEVRIAQYVTGIGNASCGPRTLNEYSNFFEGEVAWKFHLLPIASVNSLNETGSKRWPAKFNQYRNPENENLKIESIKKRPTGDWISEGAKVEYSSEDTEWAPKKDTLTTTMEGSMSFHTKKENKPWACIDLGATKDIQGALILNRNEKSLYYRAVPLEMFVSEDGNNWKKIWRTNAVKGEWEVCLENPVKARYVKLQADRHDCMHLKGVKIFGINK